MPREALQLSRPRWQEAPTPPPPSRVEHPSTHLGHVPKNHRITPSQARSDDVFRHCRAICPHGALPNHVMKTNGTFLICIENDLATKRTRRRFLSMCHTVIPSRAHKGSNHCSNFVSRSMVRLGARLTCQVSVVWYIAKVNCIMTLSEAPLVPPKCTPSFPENMQQMILIRDPILMVR